MQIASIYSPGSMMSSCPGRLCATIRFQASDEELPMAMFRYSINYLGLLFAALLIDHYLLFRINF